MLLILAIAAIPALGALILWAITELENFLLFGVLFVNIIPVSLGKPAGANVAAVDIFLILAGVSWFVNSSRRRAPDLQSKANPIFFPALVFVAISALSMIWSVKVKSTAIFTVQLVEITIVFPLLFSSIPSSLDRIRKAFVWLVSGTSVLSLVAVGAFAAHPSSGGVSIVGWNKNALGSYAAAAAVLAYALAIGWPERRGKVLLWLAFAVNAAGTIASVSRGAIIGGGVALIVTSLLLGRRRFVTMTVVAVGAVMAFSIIGPLEHQKTTISGGYNSASVRTEAWSDAVHKIEQNPILGTGGKTYSDVLTQLDSLPISDPDNMFLLAWAELGVFGVIAIAFLLYRFGRLLIDARNLDRPSAVLAVAAGGVAVSYFVHFQFDVTWTRGTTSMAFAMVGLMIAVRRLASSADLGKPSLGAEKPAGGQGAVTAVEPSGRVVVRA